MKKIISNKQGKKEIDIRKIMKTLVHFLDYFLDLL